jgi:tetratricopeptide (TPR) repeat protein
MGNLAVGYQKAGKLDLALPLLEETLKLRRAKLGPDHPDTLTSMNNLAGGYRAAGKLDLALPLYEEALKLRRAKLGPDHPHTLTSMNNLATFYWRLKKLDQSIPLFEQTLTVRRRILGEDHPDTLLTLASLGVSYRDAGRLAEALPLLEGAYARGRRHATLRWVGDALLEAYVRAGKKAEALPLIDERLKAARRQWPADSPQRATALAPPGLALLRLHAWAEAESVLRECLTIREKKLPDDWSTFNAKSMLGGAFLGQKKSAEAEPLLLQGYQGMKERAARIPPQGQVRLPEALERLVQLYEATGRPDQAAAWRIKLAAAKVVGRPVE